MVAKRYRGKLRVKRKLSDEQLNAGLTRFETGIDVKSGSWYGRIGFKPEPWIAMFARDGKARKVLKHLEVESSAQESDMGRRSELRKAFLTANPRCCFCGGTAQSTSEDHIPSRAMFRGRIWPQGHVFPACDKCQSLTSSKELIVTFLARMYPAEKEPEHQREVVEIMKGINNNFPGLLQLMTESASRKEEWLKANDHRLPEGQSVDDNGLMSLDDARIYDAVHMFATKLFLSLMYLHTKSVVPSSGGIVFRWATNADNLDEVFPRDKLAPLLKDFGELKRQDTNLADQFFYRYGITKSRRAGVFLALFNQSLAMLGFVFPVIEEVAIPEGCIVLRPFSHGRDEGD